MPVLRSPWVFTAFATIFCSAMATAQDAQEPSRVMSELYRIEHLRVMDQGVAIPTFIDSLSADELQELRAFAERDRTLMITESLWPWLLRAWGCTDGPAALACAQGRRTPRIARPRTTDVTTKELRWPRIAGG